MLRPLLTLTLALGLVACDGIGSPPRAQLSLGRALSDSPEQLEFEPAFARLELFEELIRVSQDEAGRPAETAPVLFALGDRTGLLGAPGLATRMDLLQAPDAGVPLPLSFEDGFKGWPDDRRESLQGLSEREVAELVARTLLTHWGLQPEGDVHVERAVGAPYAAAWLDGILRLNPVLLYLASAPGLPAAATTGP